jgi:hypothetical protein
MNSSELGDEYDLEFYREILSFYNTKAYQHGLMPSGFGHNFKHGPPAPYKVSNSTPTLPAAFFKSEFYYNLFN